jgi:hypothetical protein
VTSLKKILGGEMAMPEVRERYIDAFEKVFDVSLAKAAVEQSLNFDGLTLQM